MGRECGWVVFYVLHTWLSLCERHYYELFYKLERQHELDPLNETDIKYCLHFVFLPRINKHLLEFTESWNHHSISTEQTKPLTK